MDCDMVPYKPYKQKTDPFGEADRMTPVKSTLNGQTKSIYVG